MRWRAYVFGLAFAVTSLLSAEPAASQAAKPPKRILLSRPAISWSVDPAPEPVRFTSIQPTGLRNTVRFAIYDRLDLVASTAKEKVAVEKFGRRAEGPAGRPRNPRSARVGLSLRW